MLLKDNLEDHLIKSKFLPVVRQFLQYLSLEVPKIIRPQAGPIDDEVFQLVWNYKHHHIDIDLNLNGTIDWFYYNRVSQQVHSGEDQIEHINPILKSYLRTFFSNN
jgi:hypothetical protein